MSLLTIAIPTYNREDELYKCLKNLCNEISDTNADVDILISDNDSKYDVLRTIDKFRKTNITFEIIINSSNIGMTNNFLQCLSRAKGEYVWLFSDDEYINKGTLRAIVKELEYKQPDYVYLKNSRIKKNRSMKIIDVYFVSRDSLISEAGIYQTLITSNIFKRNLIDSFLNKEFNTLFPHTQLFYEVLRVYEKFIIIDGDLFEGTPNNSGGYSWFRTFIFDLLNVLENNNDIISVINRKILDKQLIRLFYFKKFLNLGLKNIKEENNQLGNYLDENFDDVYNMLKQNFSSRIDFWIFIFPVYILPHIALKFIYKFVMKIIMPIYRRRY